MKTIYLSGGDWVVKRDNIRDDTGALVNGVAARGFISDAEDGAAIHAELEVAGTITAGEFRGIVQGTAVAEHLEALLAAVEVDYGELVLYDRLVIDDQDYGDYVALRVKRGRPAGAG